MSTTTTPSGRTAQSQDGAHLELGHPEETRRSFTTTEFYVLIASVAAVIAVGYAGEDSLNTFRIWLLVTVLAGAYMVSRGLAKAGSYERRSDLEMNRGSDSPAVR